MSQNKEPRPRRTFTSELKQQIVDLYRGGKRKCDIIRVYDIESSFFDKWIARQIIVVPLRKKITALQKMPS